MVSDTDLPYQPRSFKSLKPLEFLVIVFFIVVVAGMGGYWLGIRIGQKSEINSQPVPIASTKLSTTVAVTPTIPVVPTENPAVTAHWKTYTNDKWGVSFKYPEEWFPQQVPESSQVGDAVAFYPYGVTPFTGAGDEGTNAVLIVSNEEGQRQQTDEQFISMASQIPGYQKTLNVAGKPAVKTKWQYYIKPSNTREFIFTAYKALYNEDGNKKLDSIISSIRFASE